MRTRFDLSYNFFISNLDIFPLISLSDIVSINWATDTGNYRSVLCHIMTFNTDINNNIRFEGLDIHYHNCHSLSYQIFCDTSDNVYLNLQNCLYSIYLYVFYFTFIFYLFDFVSEPVHIMFSSEFCPNSSLVLDIQ